LTTRLRRRHRSLALVVEDLAEEGRYLYGKCIVEAQNLDAAVLPLDVENVENARQTIDVGSTIDQDQGVGRNVRRQQAVRRHQRLNDRQHVVDVDILHWQQLGDELVTGAHHAP